MKHFLWRASIDSLPTKVNLAKRMVVNGANCNFCNEHDEDGLHALWL